MELVCASPARLADLLRERKLDAALASSSEYFFGDYRIIRGGALSSSHIDADAVLYAKVPYTHVRSVALSTASRSTNLLLQVLLKRLAPGSAINYVLRPEDMLRSLAEFDACLVIGDYALVEHGEIEYRYNLAQLWAEHTALPMVFTLWLAHPEANPGLAPLVQQAMALGLDNIDIIAREAAALRGMDYPLVLRYLTEALDYSWTPVHELSLAHFGEELRELGLIDHPRPIRYFGDDGG